MFLQAHFLAKLSLAGTKSLCGGLNVNILREAIKIEIRSKFGHFPYRVGGWLIVDSIVQTVYEIF